MPFYLKILLTQGTLTLIVFFLGVCTIEYDKIQIVLHKIYFLLMSSLFISLLYFIWNK